MAERTNLSTMGARGGRADSEQKRKPDIPFRQRATGSNWRLYLVEQWHNKDGNMESGARRARIRSPTDPNSSRGGRPTQPRNTVQWGTHNILPSRQWMQTPRQSPTPHMGEMENEPTAQFGNVWCWKRNNRRRHKRTHESHASNMGPPGKPLPTSKKPVVDASTTTQKTAILEADKKNSQKNENSQLHQPSLASADTSQTESETELLQGDTESETKLLAKFCSWIVRSLA